MSTELSLKEMCDASSSVQSRIREAEVFFTTSDDDLDGVGTGTLMVFSLKKSPEHTATYVPSLFNFFAYVFSLTNISVDKFPRCALVDDDNHSIELSRDGMWTEEDYLNLCILLEALSSISDWTFRYNENNPRNMSPLFKQSLVS